MNAWMPEKVLIVEESRTLTAALCHRIDSMPGFVPVACNSLASLRERFETRDDEFALAIVDLSLCDSPYGEALDYVISRSVPTIVFTSTFDVTTREKILEKQVVDYILKDNEDALDSVLAAVSRALANRHIRVLVVDDVRSSRMFLVNLLKSQLFRVMDADTGLKALEILDRHQDIELVLTDYNMPDMNGDELTRRIRKRHGSDRVRIIGVSSSNDRHLSALFLKAGASDFVHRPFVVEELQYRVANNIETLEQLRQLRTVAAGDFLTGLYNRRHFYDVGPGMVSESLDSGVPCAVAMLDIDHFKRLNDTWGHEIGDRVLKAVASRLASLVSGSPYLLCRIGGEEFALLLVGLDGEAATAFCEKIRFELAGAAIATDDEELSITVSIGVAEVKGLESFDNYLNAADQFLYMAKHRGRNQVFSDHRMAETVGLQKIA